MPKNIFKVMLVGGGAAMALSLGAWQASESNALAQDIQYQRAQAGQAQYTNRPVWTPQQGDAKPTTARVYSGQAAPAQSYSAIGRFPTSAATTSAGNFFTFEARRNTEAERKADVQIRKLLERAKASNEEEAAEVTQEIKAIVASQFDSRHDEQVAKLKKLEAQLEKTRTALASREDNRDEIIDRRVKELLGQSNPLDWNYEPGSSNTFSRRFSGSSQFFPSAPVAPASPKLSPPTGLPPAWPGVSTGPARLPVQTTTSKDLIGIAHDAARAKTSIEQTRRLVEKGVVSASELREAELLVSEANARFEASKRNLQRKLREAQAQMEAKLAELELAKTQLASAEDQAEREATQAKVRIAEILAKQVQGQLEAVAEDLSWIQSFEDEQAEAREAETKAKQDAEKEKANAKKSSGSRN